MKHYFFKLLAIVTFIFFSTHAWKRTAVIEETYESGNEKVTITYETPILTLADVMPRGDTFSIEFEHEPKILEVTYEQRYDPPLAERSEPTSSSGHHQESAQTDWSDLFKPDMDDFRQIAYEQACLRAQGNDSYEPIRHPSSVHYYPLSGAAQTLLKKHNLAMQNFHSCPNRFDAKLLHEELIRIIHHSCELADFVVKTEFVTTVDTVNSYVIPAVDIARQHNVAHNTARGWDIAGWCSKALSCTEALLIGAGIGCCAMAKNIYNHPLETAAWIAAPELMLAISIAQLTLELLPHAITAAQNGWEAYHSGTLCCGSIMAVSVLGQTMQKYLENQTIENILTTGAAFGTQLILEKKFFAHATNLFLKADMKCAEILSHRANPISLHIRSETPPNPQRHHTPKINGTAPAGHGTPTTPSTNLAEGKGNYIKVFEQKILEKDSRHIFSTSHEGKGITTLGKDREEILQEILRTIWIVDEKGFLKQGSNQIETMINNKLVTIRIFLDKDKVQSFNCFMGTTPRKLGNLITLG